MLLIVYYSNKSVFKYGTFLCRAWCIFPGLDTTSILQDWDTGSLANLFSMQTSYNRYCICCVTTPVSTALCQQKRGSFLRTTWLAGSAITGQTIVHTIIQAADPKFWSMLLNLQYLAPPIVKPVFERVQSMKIRYSLLRNSRSLWSLWCLKRHMPSFLFSLGTAQPRPWGTRLTWRKLLKL